MLVIADSSPLHSLIEIGQTRVLPVLFDRVLVPTQVAAELSHLRTPKIVSDFILSSPSWLEIRPPRQIENIPSLDIGERAAISLACETNPDFLLIDERQGRLEATIRKITVIGTIGVLERAAGQGLLRLESAFAELRKTRFHVSEALFEEAIRRFKDHR